MVFGTIRTTGSGLGEHNFNVVVIVNRNTRNNRTKFIFELSIDFISEFMCLYCFYGFYYKNKNSIRKQKDIFTNFWVL
jgi:hypothetical protein